ncbi:MAG: DUF1934 domain-containing protein [Streptococcaceae bacterium]|jgi:uncharacterized beta-barrel protein YwiB (DUF1934 family)|nr:DUF1934 domain-containing protein [Streptococcaceae bacterium]
MVEIYLKNEIWQNGDLEVVEATYRGRIFDKGGNTFVEYLESKEERVVLKINHDNFEMLRFGNQRSKLVLSKNQEATAYFYYPELTLTFKTKVISRRTADNSIKIKYQLLDIPDASVIGSYRLTIVW